MFGSPASLIVNNNAPSTVYEPTNLRGPFTAAQSGPERRTPLTAERGSIWLEGQHRCPLIVTKCTGNDTNRVGGLSREFSSKTWLILTSWTRSLRVDVK
jgi:hypothetical protein